MNQPVIDRPDSRTLRIICPPGTAASDTVDKALASITAETFTFDYHIRPDGTEVFTVEECDD
jgi:hypothetical protein